MFLTTKFFWRCRLETSYLLKHVQDLWNLITLHSGHKATFPINVKTQEITFHFEGGRVADAFGGRESEYECERRRSGRDYRWSSWGFQGRWTQQKEVRSPGFWTHYGSDRIGPYFETIFGSDGANTTIDIFEAIVFCGRFAETEWQEMRLNLLFLIFFWCNKRVNECECWVNPILNEFIFWMTNKAI